MKVSLVSCIALALGWLVLLLIQLWFSPFSAELFLKISISFLIFFCIGLIGIFVAAYKKQTQDENQQRKDKYLM